MKSYYICKIIGLLENPFFLHELQLTFKMRVPSNTYTTCKPKTCFIFDKRLNDQMKSCFKWQTEKLFQMKTCCSPFSVNIKRPLVIKDKERGKQFLFKSFFFLTKLLKYKVKIGCHNFRPSLNVVTNLMFPFW